MGFLGFLWGIPKQVFFKISITFESKRSSVSSSERGQAAV